METFGVHVSFQGGYFFLPLKPLLLEEFVSRTGFLKITDSHQAEVTLQEAGSHIRDPFSACAPHDSMDLLWRSLHSRKPVVSFASQMHLNTIDPTKLLSIGLITVTTV